MACKQEYFQLPRQIEKYMWSKIGIENIQIKKTESNAVHRMCSSILFS